MNNLSDTMSQWGTHQTPLVGAVMNTTGPVLELGSGHYSTPILHEICKAQKRLLVTIDNDVDWINQFKDLESEHHKIIHTDNWDSVSCETHYGVVFIDHAPAERRAVDIERFKNSCDIMVIHDYLQDNVYHHHEVIERFRYRYVYRRYSRQTILVSNTINIYEIFSKN